jgi:hypothetical protein
LKDADGSFETGSVIGETVSDMGLQSHRCGDSRTIKAGPAHWIVQNLTVLNNPMLDEIKPFADAFK